MNYKDTLELYDELLSGGCTEAQARAQARQVGALGDALSHSIDQFGLRLDSVDKRLDKIGGDLVWMRITGGCIFLSLLIPNISKWFGHS